MSCEICSDGEYNIYVKYSDGFVIRIHHAYNIRKIEVALSSSENGFLKVLFILLLFCWKIGILFNNKFFCV